MEIVKRAIRLMHEGKCIYDQFQLDEDYNVPDAKEDVGNVIEGTVCEDGRYEACRELSENQWKSSI